MLRINKENRIANKIKGLLNKKGFIVRTQYSKNTKSVYLTIDNGACGVIRISDHKRANTTSKYNVVKGYKGRKKEFVNGKVAIYYNFNHVNRLLADLEIERSNKVLRYGYSNYKNIRDGLTNANNLEYARNAA